MRCEVLKTKANFVQLGQSTGGGLQFILIEFRLPTQNQEIPDFETNKLMVQNNRQRTRRAAGKSGLFFPDFRR